MKRIAIILLIGILALTPVAFLYLNLRDANGKLTVATNKNVQLTSKVSSLQNELSKYEGINKQDLLKYCSERAMTEYLNYLKRNSVTVTEGNVTTYAPKSPNVHSTASENLETAKNECNRVYS